jgi:hypothetical protein
MQKPRGRVKHANKWWCWNEHTGATRLKLYIGQPCQLAALTEHVAASTNPRRPSRPLLEGDFSRSSSYATSYGHCMLPGKNRVTEKAQTCALLTPPEVQEEEIRACNLCLGEDLAFLWPSCPSLFLWTHGPSVERKLLNFLVHLFLVSDPHSSSSGYF